MILQRVLPPILVLSFGVLTQSCIPPQAPTAPVRAPTLPPAWTPTASPPLPSPSPKASSTPWPSPTTACNLESTLRAVKASIPYEQFAVHFLDLSGFTSLGIWYVDPNLTPSPSQSELERQLRDVRLSAAELSATVNAAVPCTGRVSDVINPVVVDSEYQGWFSAQIDPDHLPSGPEFTQDELTRASDHFQVGYVRTITSYASKRGTCAWPEARERLQSHFSADRQLVTFYFVIDRLGSHVWVQWDGDASPPMEMVNLLNISLALDCFSPSADVIYIVVNSRGQVLDTGVVPPRGNN